MKFEFNESDYAKMWLDQDLLTTYVDTTNILRTNYSFCWSQFTVDPSVVPTDDQGKAAYSVESYIEEAAPMMDMRAPLGKGKPLDMEGIHIYTGTIPDFIAPTFTEQAFERANKARRFEQYGNNAALMMQWTNKVQKMIDSANMTLSNMAAQLLSTGKINWTYGRASKPMVADARIPKENIVKAGTKVWTQADCPILDQMAKIEEDFRMKYGLENVPMKWQIPYKMFRENFLTNTQVKNFVKDYRTNKELPTTDGFVITEGIFREVMALYPQISPIEVIVEKQKDYTGDVHGWEDGIAVLRPRGYAGVVKHTDILDRFMFENFGSSLISKTFANVGEGGIMTLINTVANNGNYKEWGTELVMSAVPVLTEVPYHLIVKTSVAGDGAVE